MEDKEIWLYLFGKLLQGCDVIGDAADDATEALEEYKKRWPDDER